MSMTVRRVKVKDNEITAKNKNKKDDPHIKLARLTRTAVSIVDWQPQIDLYKTEKMQFLKVLRMNTFSVSRHGNGQGMMM